jgi:hypothetical protein
LFNINDGILVNQIVEGGFKDVFGYFFFGQKQGVVSELLNIRWLILNAIVGDVVLCANIHLIFVLHKFVLHKFVLHRFVYKIKYW